MRSRRSNNRRGGRAGGEQFRVRKEGWAVRIDPEFTFLTFFLSGLLLFCFSFEMCDFRHYFFFHLSVQRWQETDGRTSNVKLFLQWNKNTFAKAATNRVGI